MKGPRVALKGPRTHWRQKIPKEENYNHVTIRDVSGKEREKIGTGKKLERNTFFPFPFLHFLTTFFPVFGENRQEQVKKGLERQKNGGKM